MKFEYLIALTLLPLGFVGCGGDNSERMTCIKVMESQEIIMGAHIPALEYLIGKNAANITSVDGFKLFRTIAPNSTISTYYRPERANLLTDCDGNIIATSAH